MKQKICPGNLPSQVVQHKNRVHRVKPNRFLGKIEQMHDQQTAVRDPIIHGIHLVRVYKAVYLNV